MFDIEEEKSRSKIFEVILLVIVIITFFTVIITAVNPSATLASGRDAQRQYDVIQISNAVYRYLSSSRTLDQLEQEAGVIEVCEQGSSDIGTTIGKIDLLKVLVDDYIYAMPVDPINGCNLNDTCYDICKSSRGNRITILAPNAENYSIQAIR